MAAPGRKPKPASVHELNGNPSKLKDLKARQESEVKTSAGVPSCPAWMDGIARTEWRRIAPLLAKMGLLSPEDRAALTGYCAAYSRWVRAETAIIERTVEENGKKVPNNGLTYGPKSKRQALPEVKIAEAALNQVRQFCAEFGLTPSSRARMAIPGKPPADEDPLDKAIKEANRKAREVLK